YSDRVQRSPRDRQYGQDTRPLGSLIIGISLIQLANGYAGTLIGIRLGAATLAPIVAGIVMSAYFAGYATGAVLCGPLIDSATSLAFRLCRPSWPELCSVMRSISIPSSGRCSGRLRGSFAPAFLSPPRAGSMPRRPPPRAVECFRYTWSLPTRPSPAANSCSTLQRPAVPRSSSSLPSCSASLSLWSPPRRPSNPFRSQALG